MEELTAREYKLMYDAVQRHIDILEDMIYEHTETKEVSDIIRQKVKELENILDKIGEKTIDW